MGGSRQRLINVAVIFVVCTPRAAQALNVLVVNRGTSPVDILQPRGWIDAGKTWWKKFSGPLELVTPTLRTHVADGDSYQVVMIDPSGATSEHDPNALQLAISTAAHGCSTHHNAPSSAWEKCVAEKTLDGLPQKFVRRAFKHLWSDHGYWNLCEAKAATSSVRSRALRTGSVIEVLRESPLVAAARGFVSHRECEQLMIRAGMDSLTRAHIGSGGGGTSTSEARETLTTNMFINWDVVDVLSNTSARMFDFASELLGENVPYEGQEPVNFLHYLPGFEYKPHEDGSASSRGKRVATTLVYCHAADRGGATVFPIGTSEELKFVPRAGDILFFQYAPHPYKALHAACPVSAGNKSTLTQWHRLGVSSDKPWDLFEDWGRFHNPHASSRWPGPRYGMPPEEPTRVEI